MKGFSKKRKKVVPKEEKKTAEAHPKVRHRVSKKAQTLLKPAGNVITSAGKTTGDAGKVVAYWAGQQISGGYSLLAKGIGSSKAMAASTGKSVLGYVSSAYESSAKAGKKGVNQAAILVNAILASDFSREIEHWLDDAITKGAPSIYDKAVDYVYNTTHIGGGKLHRLFDGSHTLSGMWDKVHGITDKDGPVEEIIGYFNTLWKDLATPVGIPLSTWSKESYHEVAGYLKETFDIPKDWFSDLLHVNEVELIGTTIGTIAVALNWNKKQVEQFAGIAGSLGIASMASANPALAVVGLVTLAKAFVDARQEGGYRKVVVGFSKRGVGTGAILATAVAIPGPGWVGIVAGMCVGSVVRKTMNTVEVSQIASFMETSLRKAVAQIETPFQGKAAMVPA